VAQSYEARSVVAACLDQGDTEGRLLIQPCSVGRWLVSEAAGSEVDVPWSGPGLFCWSQRSMDGAVVVCLAGELDVSTVELGPLLRGVVESGAAAMIVLDMSDVCFIDAYSIGLIVGAWKAAKARDRVLRVDGLRGLPARVFRLLELESILLRRPCGDVTEGMAGG
jgi:anti-anti-sigma factor